MKKHQIPATNFLARLAQNLWKGLIFSGIFVFFAAFSSPILKAADTMLASLPENTTGVPNNDTVPTACVCPIFEQMDGNPNCKYETACPTVFERIQQWQVNVSPHPISENFTVFVNGQNPPMCLDLQIVDTENRVVMHVGATNGERLNLSAETLRPGQYLVQFSLNGQVVIMKRFMVYRN